MRLLRLLQSSCVAIVALASDSGVCNQSHNRILSPGQPEIAQLSPGQTVTFTLSLPANGRWLLVVQERGIDSALTSLSGENIRLNGPVILNSTEFAIVRAREPTFHSFTITAAKTPAPSGNARVELFPIDSTAGSFANALRSLRQAASLARSDDLASRNRSLSLYDKAATAIADSGGPQATRIQAEALLAAGELAFGGRDRMATEHYFQRSAKIFAALDERIGQIVALNSLGLHFYYADELEKAATLFNEGLATNLLAADPILGNYLKFNLCLIDLRLRRLEAAEKCLKSTADTAKTLGDLRSMTSSNDALAGVYSKRGEPERALQPLLKVLKARKSVGERDLIALTHNNIAIQYGRLGDIQSELAHYLQALESAAEQGNTHRLHLFERNVGATYLKLGETLRAREFFVNALASARSAGFLSESASILIDLGRVAVELEDFDRARELFAQAQAEATRLGDNALLARVSLETGRSFLIEGQPERSLAHLQQSKELNELFDASALAIAETALLMGRAELAGDNVEKAGAYLTNAHSGFERVRYRIGIAASLESLAEFHYRLENRGQAESLAQEAIAVMSSVRGNLASIDLRAQFGSAQRNAYDLLVDIEMDREKNSPGHDLRALALSDRARAQTLTEILRSAEADPDLDIPKDLLDERQRLLQRINYAAAAEFEHDVTEVDTREHLMALDVIDAKIIRAAPQALQVSGRDPLDIQSLQARLRDGDVIIQYHLGTRRAFAWAISKDEIISRELAPSATIRQSAQSLVTALRERRPVRSDAAALGNLVVRPLGEILSGKSSLIVVADGILNYVPFETLSVEADSDALLDNFTVSYTPSLSTLALIRGRGISRDFQKARISVFADPVFNDTDQRIPAEHRATATQAGQRNNTLNRLPLTGNEANAIAGLLPASRVSVSRNAAANRAAMLDGDLHRFDIIHIATHGVVNTERPELTGLTLSLVDESGQPTDGFIGIRDIYGLDLNAELVVLSACDTGLGRAVRGEGLIGLARGFMYAGAGQIVASLWPVQDRATAALMGEFYKGLLIEGLPVAAALRAAKLQIRSSRRWRHPFYWSGFVLQGDRY